MTLLTVDVGNSQTVLATFDGDQRIGCWRVTTAPGTGAEGSAPSSTMRLAPSTCTTLGM